MRINSKHVMIIFLVLLLLGCCRIFFASSQFSMTIDEPVHISTGMEWIRNGRYTQETLHPPLARALAAAALYASGTGFSSEERASTKCRNSFIDGYKNVEANHKNGFFMSYCADAWDHDIVFNGDYERNLMFARLPMLLFYIMTCVFTYLISAKYLPQYASLLAAALVSFSPTMLGHSGIVGTDMAVVGASLMAIYALIVWFEAISIKSSFFLGFSIGISFLAKFSAAVFLLPSFALISLFYCSKLRFNRRLLYAIFIVIVSCFFVVWAGYRFSVGVPVQSIPYLSEAVENKSDLLKNIATARWLPMPEFIEGIYSLKQKQEKGHAGYLLGDVMQNVPWYYFPVAIFCKTSLFIQALWCFGVWAIIKAKNARLAIPLLLIGVLFVPLFFSNIALGVRHALILVPFISIVAAYGAYYLLCANKKMKIIGGILLSLFFILSLRAHPHYLPYFNEATDYQPERTLVISDFDYGQDMGMLLKYIQEKGIPDVKICSAVHPELIRKFNLRNVVSAECSTPEAGYFAVRAGMLYAIERDKLKWFLQYKPQERIGKTIFLYHISDDDLNK